MNNPIVKGFVLEQLRRNAERVRSAYIHGTNQVLSATEELAPVLVAGGYATVDGQTGALVAVAEFQNEPVEDGLVGKMPLTVGELCELVNKLGALTAAIDADPQLVGLVVKACVRPPEVVG